MAVPGQACRGPKGRKGGWASDRKMTEPIQKVPSVASRPMCVVSACLAGLRCRYDGGSCEYPRVVELVRSRLAIPVCPEQLGGLPTPRLPARIVKGGVAPGESSSCIPESAGNERPAGGEEVIRGVARVMNSRGEDVTGQFIRGAEECLRVARLVKADGAILKSGSPSCGSSADGASGEGRPTDGVTTALLRRNGIRIMSENQLAQRDPVVEAAAPTSPHRKRTT